MNRIIFVLSIIIAISGCTPRILPHTDTNEETIIIEKSAAISEELIIQSCTDFEQSIKIDRQILALPVDMTINENINIIVRKNGLVEIDGKLFVYKTVDERQSFEDDISLTLYKKNNLLGMNIGIQYFTGGTAPYTLVINIETMEELQFEKYPDILTLFRDFISIDNIFIIALCVVAYAYDDSTGELLWMQAYNQRLDRRIIVNADHFIIDDIDGNKYRIYSDGRKEKILH